MNADDNIFPYLTGSKWVIKEPIVRKGVVVFPVGYEFTLKTPTFKYTKEKSSNGVYRFSIEKWAVMIEQRSDPIYVMDDKNGDFIKEQSYMLSSSSDGQLQTKTYLTLRGVLEYISKSTRATKLKPYKIKLDNDFNIIEKTPVEISERWIKTIKKLSPYCNKIGHQIYEVEPEAALISTKDAKYSDCKVKLRNLKRGSIKNVFLYSDISNAVKDKLALDDAIMMDLR